jgi:hypothetical protein
MAWTRLVRARHQLSAMPGHLVWGIALVSALASAPPALGQTTATVQEALQLAVCLNDWDSAIDRTLQLEQVPGIPIKTQAQLVQFRRQMQVWRQNQTAVSNISGCEPVLAGFGIPGYTGRPLEVERALANAGLIDPIVVPDVILQEQAALWQASLGVTADTPLAPLAAAQRINTRTGSGVSTGAVSRRVDIYAFVAAQGDLADFSLTVTQQRQGLLFTDAQALLFLFDAEGRLLAEARTTAATSPRLTGLPLPSTGGYYIAVTTPEHRPVLDDGGFIVGWQGIGTSAITYTLTLTGLTPSPQLGIAAR